MDAKYFESLFRIYAALYDAVDGESFFFSDRKVVFCNKKLFEELFPDSKEEYYSSSKNVWERRAELGGLQCILYVYKEKPDDV